MTKRRDYADQGRIIFDRQTSHRGNNCEALKDTSVVLAEHIAGSGRAFVEKMNHFLLMVVEVTQTRFEDASGLSKSDFQFTTAYDMALIMRYIAIDYPDYYETYFAKTSLWDRKWYDSCLRNRLTKKGVVWSS